MQHKLISLSLFLAFFALSCSQDKKLPFLGPKQVNATGDTLYHQISFFQFLNQDSVLVSEKDVAGKVYVADFFFTTCPTICPKMKTQMLRIYERYKERADVCLLSHSIDPDFDTPSVLHDYATRLHISAPKWNLLTGDKSKIYTLGQKSYMVSAQEDPAEAGGFVHSGAFILVDKNRHVRGIYDGTVEAEVNRLLEDMELLLKE
jgi:protein SCO1/2